MEPGVTYHDPEPWDPDRDSREARIQAGYEATSERLAAERRDRFNREFERLYGPPEGRHAGEDDGAHHWADAITSGMPYQQKRPRCGCGCEASGPAPRGTPVDGLLDELDRNRYDKWELAERAYERGRAEMRAWLDASRGPMSASEAMVRLAELRVTEFRPEWR